MMKSKLLIILSLLFVLSLDGLALVEKANGSNASAAFSPDGVAVTKMQRRRKKRRRRYKAQRPTSYPVMAMPDTGATPPEASPAPLPAPPPAEEMPVMSAPPPVAEPPMDNPGRSRPMNKSGGPRIKPPTVNIKPPTE
ncbi:MAG: hypothetical protein H0U54_07205 [Acidobacteria bacterium]|nr:hypothetical protein [Acidobacteriota bacterium]